MSDPVVLIPARMASTRLPGKPLADIAGEPMIVHVWRRARARPASARSWWRPTSRRSSRPIEAAGGEAVLTRADHPSGSDRIFEALANSIRSGRHDVVVNVQGDLPTIDPAAVAPPLAPLADPRGRHRHARRRDHRARRSATDPNVVKVVGSPRSRRRVLRALYFTRATAPCGRGAALPPHRPLRLSPRGA